jgi:hypothetical protein
MGTVQLTAVPVQPVYHEYELHLSRIATKYSVIAEPLSAGASQFIRTSLPMIVVVGAAGVEGTVGGSIAALPAKDAAEGPTEFMALIRA